MISAERSKSTHPTLLVPVVVTFLLLSVTGRTTAAADLVIVENGRPRAAIFVAARLMDDAKANPEPESVWRSLKPEDNRRRLRESVKDLAAILQRMTGASIEVVEGAPAADEKRIPILVGELADDRFGKPQKSFPYQQGFRLVVSERGVGMAGESDLAISYAIYTLLDQLGCRWYMPSPMGEALPAKKTLALKTQDLSTGPFTIYRGIWYCDNDFARRNRLGGMAVSAGHALEYTVTKDLRKTHPEIRAVIGGTPHEHKIKWTHPLVAKAITDACLDQIKKDPSLNTFSLSPDDGTGWDESDDAKLDAGDFDPANQTVSKTDRLMVLCNRVAKAVTGNHPQVKFGVLAYVDYTRPPVREKVHPSVVPQVAPITFSRAHPMTDDGEPNNRDLRALVEGWGRAAPATSYYFYGWFLAEASAPNPMITKWSVDVPYVYAKGNCRYWQPETIPNFESCLHAHTLGIRLAWDPTLKPAKIVRELHEKFYGAAAKEMAAYWHHVDDVWVKTPEYAGAGFGHLRRWTPTQLGKARQLIDRAAAACNTEAEKARVRLASESLALFEVFMKLRRDHAEGRFTDLATEGKRCRDALNAAAERYKDQYAFAQMYWTKPDSINARYFDSFYRATYEDAARIASGFKILTDPPLRRWRYQPDKEEKGHSAGWSKRNFDDSSWRSTDCVVDTWSSLGLHNFMGSMWYRTTVKVPVLPLGKKVYLWLGSTDGRAKVFVNGKHVPYIGPKGEKTPDFNGFCQPASFDVTAAIESRADNQVTILCTREFLNEIGTGGLLSPALLYREKGKD
jgi:hypothetical protein